MLSPMPLRLIGLVSTILTPSSTRTRRLGCTDDPPSAGRSIAEAPPNRVVMMKKDSIQTIGRVIR